MYMYIYMYTYIHTYIHTYIYTNHFLQRAQERGERCGARDARQDALACFFRDSCARVHSSVIMNFKTRSSKTWLESGSGLLQVLR